MNDTNPHSPKNWESERPSAWSNRTPALSIVSEPVEPKIQSNKKFIKLRKSNVIIKNQENQNYRFEKIKGTEIVIKPSINR